MKAVMVKSLVMAPELDAMFRQVLAKSTGGVERCGYVLGRCSGVHWSCERLVPVRNARRRFGGFCFSEKEIQRARKRAQTRGADLVAVYHTHPEGPGTPSAADLASLRRSAVPWLIIAPEDQSREDDRPFRINGYAAPNGTRLPLVWQPATTARPGAAVWPVSPNGVSVRGGAQQGRFRPARRPPDR